MFKRRVNLCAVILIALTACTKQDITPISESVSSNEADQAGWWHWPPPPPPSETTWGLSEESTSSDQTKQRMNNANLKLTRIPIVLSTSTMNKAIDNYINDGYDVQINITWSGGTNGYREFPTDTFNVKTKAEAFFSHYAQYKDHIPFVGVENEWDYQVQHGSNLQNFLNEFSAITTVGRKYGFNIADGGITSGALQRWTYSQLTGSEKEQWSRDYYVGNNADDYLSLMNIVNTFVARAKIINYDYANVHWYNTSDCDNGFERASQIFMNACGKSTVVCNEFGIRTNSQTLFDQTADEIRGNAKYAIAYSGTNKSGKAIKLSDPMLDYLVK